MINKGKHPAKQGMDTLDRTLQLKLYIEIGR